MGPPDPATSKVIGADVATQTAVVFDHLESILRAAGMGLDTVAKVTTHLQNLDRDFAEYDRVHRTRFNDPFPARTTVGSTLAGILVEMNVVAYAG